MYIVKNNYVIIYEQSFYDLFNINNNIFYWNYSDISTLKKNCFTKYTNCVKISVKKLCAWLIYVYSVCSDTEVTIWRCHIYFHMHKSISERIGNEQ